MNTDERDTRIEGIYEQLLIVRCQVGDELAFNELLSRYQPRLALFVQRLMQHSDGVEDVLQEVWLDVFKGLSKLKDTEAFRGWLYRIARDRVAQRHRKRRFQEHPLEELVAAADSEEDNFSSRIPELEAALRTLNPEHNEVLVLRYLEELSYEEIAAVTSSPVGTVRSRLHYAKNALRATLDTEKDA